MISCSSFSFSFWWTSDQFLTTERVGVVTESINVIWLSKNFSKHREMSVILRQLFNSLTYIHILCMKPSPESRGNSTKNSSISTVMAIQSWLFIENWKEVEFSPTYLHLLAKSNIADLEVSSWPVRQMTDNHAILNSWLRILTWVIAWLSGQKNLAAVSFRTERVPMKLISNAKLSNTAVF